MLRLDFILPTVAALVVISIHALFLTNFRGEFLVHDTFSSAYDSLGENLLDGRVEVDPRTIGWEGTHVGGKTLIYFGPFPALLRNLQNRLFPSCYGLWARLSCLLASILSVAALGRIITNALDKNLLLRPGQRTSLKVLWIFAFGLGSPMLFLCVTAWIYHEAEIWGLAWSLAALALLPEVFGERRPIRAASFFGACAGCALLSRIMFGIPLYLIIGGMIIGRIFSRLNISWRALTAMCACAAVGAFYQLWYDWARYGSIFETFDYAHFYLHPEQFGGIFNVRRIPSTLHNYFSFSSAHFRSTPPYVRMLSADYFPPELFYSKREQVLSCFPGCSWLLLFAAYGTWHIVRNRRWFSMYAASMLFVQAFLIFSFFFTTQRYLADVLPVLVFVGAEGCSTPDWKNYWPLKAGVIGVLVCISCVATMVATLAWNIEFMQAGDKYPDFVLHLIMPVEDSESMSAWTQGL